ncbi:MAG: hypothetical protein HQ508_00695 [Candidatus Marinimicrobia bacterium]|nr:hypothetical protein [Candidatus Neomarinimicrobiota bacterium]
MKKFLATVFFYTVVAGGLQTANADQLFSVIEVYCGEKDKQEVLDIQFSMRGNFHFLYDGDTERFIWTEKPLPGSYECKVGKNSITLKYDQMGDPMSTSPVWPHWLAEPNAEQRAKLAEWVPFDVKFEFLIDGKQFIEPITIIENCGVYRGDWDRMEVLRFLIKKGPTGSPVITVERIGIDYKSDYAYIAEIDKKFPDFCFD